MNRTRKSLLVGLIVPVVFSAQSHAADINEHTIKLSHVLTKEHPYQIGAQKFAEILSQKTNGKIKVKTYSDGTLGSETQSLTQLQGGIQEMTLVSTAPLVGVVKEFSLFDMPFLFSDEKEADAVLDGTVGRMVLDKLSEKGIIGLCFWENGFRHVATIKRPIQKVDDLKGLKLRVIQSPVYVDTFNALGVNPIALAWTEVFSAVESKAVDGLDNSYTVLRTGKFSDTIKYLSATKHAYAPTAVLVGKKFWEKLTPTEKTILQSSCSEAGVHERKASREASAKDLAALVASGVAFNEVPPQELAKMREKVKPVIDKYTKELGEDLFKQTYVAIEKAKASK